MGAEPENDDSLEEPTAVRGGQIPLIATGLSSIGQVDWLAQIEVERRFSLVTQRSEGTVNHVRRSVRYARLGHHESTARRATAKAIIDAPLLDGVGLLWASGRSTLSRKRGAWTRVGAKSTSRSAGPPSMGPCRLPEAGCPEMAVYRGFLRDWLSLCPPYPVRAGIAHALLTPRFRGPVFGRGDGV
jgi:hypothetical protein